MNQDVLSPVTSAQIAEFEANLQHCSTTVSGRNVTAAEQLFTLLENIVLQGRDPIKAIEAVSNLLVDVQGDSSSTAYNITTCLLIAVEQYKNSQTGQGVQCRIILIIYSGLVDRAASNGLGNG